MSISFYLFYGTLILLITFYPLFYAKLTFILRGPWEIGNYHCILHHKNRQQQLILEISSRRSTRSRKKVFQHLLFFEYEFYLKILLDQSSLKINKFLLSIMMSVFSPTSSVCCIVPSGGLSTLRMTEIVFFPHFLLSEPSTLYLLPRFINVLLCNI